MALSLLVTALLSCVFLHLFGLVNAGGLLIPLYTFPSIIANGGGYQCVGSDYVKVATSAAAQKTIAIVNPTNGPDYGGDVWKKLSYDTCIAYLQSNGVEVIGYVHTKLGFPSIYAYRSIEEVTQDIDQWYTEYSMIDGIFVDEMTNRWPDATFDSIDAATSFYRGIVDLILSEKDPNARVVLNPGSVYQEEVVSPYYGNEQVIVVIFESMQWNFQRDNCLWSLWTDTQGSFDQGPFCNYVPNWDNVESLIAATGDNSQMTRNQNAVMIYGANPIAEDTTKSFTHGLQFNIGWYYITERWDWAATPTEGIWNEQVAMALAL